MIRGELPRPWTGCVDAGGAEGVRVTTGTALGPVVPVAVEHPAATTASTTSQCGLRDREGIKGVIERAKVADAVGHRPR
jgi:hypothetical protein